jgi:hypothetical protein
VFHGKSRKRIDGETYEYWTLCESVRTERGLSRDDSVGREVIAKQMLAQAEE